MSGIDPIDGTATASATTLSEQQENKQPIINDNNKLISPTSTATLSGKPLISPLSGSVPAKFQLCIPISLNIKNLFEQPKVIIDRNKKPKNIDKLDALAKPLHSNKKFTQQLLDDIELQKSQHKATELAEPKNLEWIKRMSEPLVKVEKYNPEEQERIAKDAAKNTSMVCMPYIIHYYYIDTM